MIRKYIYGPGIDNPVVMIDSSGDRFYYFADALGSVRLITDSNGLDCGKLRENNFGQISLPIEACHYKIKICKCLSLLKAKVKGKSVDITEAIKKRYSCRAYQDRPIESEKMAELLEAARLAPSARNLQDWRFVVVSDYDTKVKLTDAANGQKFVAQAAAVIVACSSSNHVMGCGQAVGPIDVSIALEHIALAAVGLGLGTCWIGSFVPEKVRAVLGIPEDIAIIELMTVGYPADKQGWVKRLGVEKIVSFEKWDF